MTEYEVSRDGLVLAIEALQAVFVPEDPEKIMAVGHLFTEIKSIIQELDMGTECFGCQEFYDLEDRSERLAEEVRSLRNRRDELRYSERSLRSRNIRLERDNKILEGRVEKQAALLGPTAEARSIAAHVEANIKARISDLETKEKEAKERLEELKRVPDAIRQKNRHLKRRIEALQAEVAEYQELLAADMWHVRGREPLYHSDFYDDDSRVNCEDEVFARERERAFESLLSTLTNREERVLRMRFYEELDLDRVGERMGVSRERVRQIECKALRKLRHPSRSKRVKAFCVYKQGDETRKVHEDQGSKFIF